MSVNLHWKADVSSEVLDNIEFLLKVCERFYYDDVSEYVSIQDWVAETRRAFLVNVCETPEKAPIPF